MKTPAALCVVCILSVLPAQAEGPLQDVLQTADSFNALFLNAGLNTALLDGGVTVDVRPPTTVAAPEMADLDAGVVTDGVGTAPAPDITITEVSTGVTGVIQTGTIDVGVRQGPLLVSPDLLPLTGGALTGGLQSSPTHVGVSDAGPALAQGENALSGTSEAPEPIIVQTTGPLVLSNDSRNTGNVYGGVSVSGRIGNLEMDEVSTNAVGVQSAGTISIVINNE
jgi:hypothetical protein